MVRRFIISLAVFGFLLTSSGAALAFHEHESSNTHASEHCALCAHVLSMAAAVVGVTVLWPAVYDAPAARFNPTSILAPGLEIQTEPGAPRAPPACA